MSVGRFWLDHSNHVDSPHGERPRGREYVEKRWWHMNSISVDLAFVTPLCILVLQPDRTSTELFKINEVAIDCLFIPGDRKGKHRLKPTRENKEKGLTTQRKG